MYGTTPNYDINTLLLCLFVTYHNQYFQFSDFFNSEIIDSCNKFQIIFFAFLMSNIPLLNKSKITKWNFWYEFGISELNKIHNIGHTGLTIAKNALESIFISEIYYVRLFLCVVIKNVSAKFSSYNITALEKLTLAFEQLIIATYIFAS